jgi:hypothetical protein
MRLREAVHVQRREEIAELHRLATGQSSADACHGLHRAEITMLPWEHPERQQDRRTFAQHAPRVSEERDPARGAGYVGIAAPAEDDPVGRTRVRREAVAVAGAQRVRMRLGRQHLAPRFPEGVVGLVADRVEAELKGAEDLPPAARAGDHKPSTWGKAGLQRTRLPVTEPAPHVLRIGIAQRAPFDLLLVR